MSAILAAAASNSLAQPFFITERTLSIETNDIVYDLISGLHLREHPKDSAPNCFFIMSISQSGFTVNFTHMLGEAGRHLAFLIKRALDESLESLEVSEQAEAEWVETILSRASLGDLQQTRTPSYYNNEGKPGEVSRQNFFFGGPMEFMKILEDARAEGGMKGFELRKT